MSIKYRYPKFFVDTIGNYKQLWGDGLDNRIPTHIYVQHLLEAGNIPVQVMGALGVPKRTFLSWIDHTSAEYQPDLASAWEIGLVRCEAYHIEDMNQGLRTTGYNWQAKKAFMTYAFEDWKNHEKDIQPEKQSGGMESLLDWFRGMSAEERAAVVKAQVGQNVIQ